MVPNYVIWNISFCGFMCGAPMVILYNKPLLVLFMLLLGGGTAMLTHLALCKDSPYNTQDESPTIYIEIEVEEPELPSIV